MASWRFSSCCEMRERYILMPAACSSFSGCWASGNFRESMRMKRVGAGFDWHCWQNAARAGNQWPALLARRRCSTSDNGNHLSALVKRAGVGLIRLFIWADSLEKFYRAISVCHEAHLKWPWLSMARRYGGLHERLAAARYGRH